MAATIGTNGHFKVELVILAYSDGMTLTKVVHTAAHIHPLRTSEQNSDNNYCLLQTGFTGSFLPLVCHSLI